jgi:biopolymer transport protein ExbB
MSQPTKQTASSSSNNEMFAPIAIIVSFVVAALIFIFIMGSPSNFEGNDPVKGHPLGFLGIIHKGGFIVPILMGFFLIVMIFSVERFLTLRAAAGSGSIAEFTKKIQSFLQSGDVSGATALCDKQKGSVANVVKSGLHAYSTMSSNNSLTKEQKILTIQKEIEEATSLEMPMLERNLPILSTIASVGTLVALLGTVIGMIKAFQAMANSGAPDAVALSTGISEALINTALGIGTSAIAIILYNYFTTKIDGMSYNIEEAGFSMAQTFAAKH